MNLKNKKILVTGADGFIGSHLVEDLLGVSSDVKALVQYNSMGSWGWLEESEYKNDFEIVLGDIRDSHFTKQLVSDVDIVFNLAALIAIPYSYIAPDSYIDTNIKGTLNICQAAKENETELVIQISTSEVYGTAQYVPIDEKHPLQPQSPYSASKIGSDSIAMSFHNAFDLNVILARPFNTYGPRQSARAIIPTIITQIASGNEKLKLGSLSPTRDLNYVKDTCQGLVSIAECNEAIGQVINIGSGREISIGELAEKIKQLMSSNIEIVEDIVRVRPKNSEVERLLSDNTLIKKLTGYSPKLGLTAGLKETIDWFTDNENLKKYKGDIYNV